MCPTWTPKSEAYIFKILEIGHIKQIQKGEWLSKPLTDSKTHQDNVTDIKDFVWSFCTNYIPINPVNKIVAMPIPCCDKAPRNEFGGEFHWIMDDISGYNQIFVANYSQPKLDFADPNCYKYAYTVMPFGPVIYIFLLTTLPPLGKNWLVVAVFQLTTTLIEKS